MEKFGSQAEEYGLDAGVPAALEQENDKKVQDIGKVSLGGLQEEERRMAAAAGKLGGSRTWHKNSLQSDGGTARD